MSQCCDAVLCRVAVFQCCVAVLCRDVITHMPLKPKSSNKICVIFSLLSGLVKRGSVIRTLCSSGATRNSL